MSDVKGRPTRANAFEAGCAYDYWAQSVQESESEWDTIISRTLRDFLDAVHIDRSNIWKEIKQEPPESLIIDEIISKQPLAEAIVNRQLNDYDKDIARWFLIGRKFHEIEQSYLKRDGHVVSWWWVDAFRRAMENAGVKSSDRDEIEKKITDAIKHKNTKYRVGFTTKYGIEFTKVAEKLRDIANQIEFDERESEMEVRREQWEQSMNAFDRIVSMGAGVIIIALAVFLLVRNKPIASHELFFLLRVVISFCVATLGATIPGFVNLSWSRSSLVVRAGGAMALFVLTFLYTPSVIP